MIIEMDMSSYASVEVSELNFKPEHEIYFPANQPVLELSIHQQKSTIPISLTIVDLEDFLMEMQGV